MSSWLLDHSINPKLAHACGVTGTPGGDITFRCGVPYRRVRKPDGSMRQIPTGLGMRLWWPVGGDRGAHSVLLCEGEADCLAAASILCDSAGEPRESLPTPLAGLCPVGLPGTSTGSHIVCGELLAANCRECFICLDGDTAGQNAAARLAFALQEIDIRAIAIGLPEGKDLSDCLVDTEDRTYFLADLIASADATADVVA